MNCMYIFFSVQVRYIIQRGTASGVREMAFERRKWLRCCRCVVRLIGDDHFVQSIVNDALRSLLRLWSNDKIDHFLFEWISIGQPLQAPGTPKKKPLSPRPPSNASSRATTIDLCTRLSLSFCPAMSFSFAPNWVACAITKKKHNNHRFVTNKISKFLCWVKRRYKSSQCAPFFPPSDFPKKRNENKTKIKCWKNRWATGKLATMWRNIFAL